MAFEHVMLLEHEVDKTCTRLKRELDVICLPNHHQVVHHIESLKAEGFPSTFGRCGRQNVHETVARARFHIETSKSDFFRTTLVNSFIPSHSCQFIHFNAFISLLSWFMSLDSFQLIHFVSFLFTHLLCRKDSSVHQVMGNFFGTHLIDARIDAHIICNDAACRPSASITLATAGREGRRLLPHGRAFHAACQAYLIPRRCRAHHGGEEEQKRQGHVGEWEVFLSSLSQTNLCTCLCGLFFFYMPAWPPSWSRLPIFGRPRRDVRWCCAGPYINIHIHIHIYVNKYINKYINK